ncbi:PilN domain-containing protein [Sphingomonas sp. H39-1-10]|uniref:PilN domain-containing protein n=1 Tax=Sphingomonas pollutisoli TaxID=3030829 RepID=UPI0023B88852|nr:PilN domain-containing protein [Sphingomonas pollutisoli]MDF0487769.1 PilN domain-containing protein [Sphingomonas pollutisoli]
MSGRGILDADMQTLGRWAARGWRWWLAELHTLVPAQLRRSSDNRLPRFLFRAGSLSPIGSHKGQVRIRKNAGLRTILVVHPELTLKRTIERPVLDDHDLPQVLAFEAESLVPFPAESVVLAGRAIGPAAEPGKILIEIASLPIETAREIATVTREDNILPLKIVVNGGRAVELDFAPAMRSAGLIAKPRSATPLIWGCVGFLAALNLATLIWKDVASVDRFAQIVDGQQPSVSVAQTITRRIELDRSLVQSTLRLRQTHDALHALATTSTTLPAGAWLQRYVWDGSTVRLTGYKPPKTDVATALRRSDRFSEVRSMADETQAAVPAGEPFDISARIIRR